MADPQPQQLMSVEEMRRIAPNYRGKPENLNPKGAKKAGAKPKDAKGPKSFAVPKPKLIEANVNPTPQRNDPLISEAIFGQDVTVTPINPRENFSANYALLPALARETYDQYYANNPMIDRQLFQAEMVYYSVCLLWLRLLNIKAMQSRTALSGVEKDILKATKEQAFNVPQPIYVYLAQIGNFTDLMGKETELEIPALPTVAVGGFGGYHAARITAETHNLFEEVPSLGIAADAVMAAASATEAITQTVRVEIPAGSRVGMNLSCFAGQLGPRRMEIRQRLNSYGITTEAFPEFSQHTRFDLKYALSLSDIVGKQETFKLEKVQFGNMTLAGGDTQVIFTKPSIEAIDLQTRWTETTVQATSASSESTAQMGASYVFGFQLYKEQGQGNDATLRSKRWSCIERDTTAEAPWAISQAWLNSRNARRNVPEGVGTERFRSISKRQDFSRSSVVRLMIKTKR